MLFALPGRQQRFVVGIFAAGLKGMLSIWTQPAWVQSHGTGLARWSGWSGMFSLLDRMLNYHYVGQKPAPNYLWLESLLCGQTTLSQFSKPRAALLDFRLIQCDNSYSFPAWILRQGMVLAVDHRSEWPAKPHCFQHNFGANPGPEQCWLVYSWELMPGEANRTMDPALCRPYPCLSISPVVFWGICCSVCIKFSAVA